MSELATSGEVLQRRIQKLEAELMRRQMALVRSYSVMVDVLDYLDDRYDCCEVEGSNEEARLFCDIRRVFEENRWGAPCPGSRLPEIDFDKLYAIP